MDESQKSSWVKYPLKNAKKGVLLLGKFMQGIFDNLNRLAKFGTFKNLSL
jgi:hypothetical protein